MFEGSYFLNYVSPSWVVIYLIYKICPVNNFVKLAVYLNEDLCLNETAFLLFNVSYSNKLTWAFTEVDVDQDVNVKKEIINFVIFSQELSHMSLFVQLITSWWRVWRALREEPFYEFQELKGREYTLRIESVVIP